MSTTAPPTRPVAGFGLATAAGTWLAVWFGGNVLGTVVIGLSGHDGTGTLPTSVTVLGALALWTPMIVGLGVLSRRRGTGSWRRDLGWSFRPVDLLGIPIGLVTQLLLLRVLYWPLESVWPDVFDPARVERSATELYEAADGWWLLGLVLMVVVGAPVVEELLYRGLLLGALGRCLPTAVAVAGSAAWFALIHFRPVEYPGLFLIGLVLAGCTVATGRIGMAVVAHAAFNAAGLAWVAW